jgi:hypothetical protein
MARVRRGAWRSAANAGIGTREAFASRLSAVSGLRYFKRVDEANHELGGEATYFLEVDEDGDAYDRSSCIRMAKCFGTRPLTSKMTGVRFA